MSIVNFDRQSALYLDPNPLSHVMRKPALCICENKGADQLPLFSATEINGINNGAEAETRKSQASFQIIQVSSEALPRMSLE